MCLYFAMFIFVVQLFDVTGMLVDHNRLTIAAVCNTCAHCQGFESQITHEECVGGMLVGGLCVIVYAGSDTHVCDM